MGGEGKKKRLNRQWTFAVRSSNAHASQQRYAGVSSCYDPPSLSLSPGLQAGGISREARNSAKTLVGKRRLPPMGERLEFSSCCMPISG